MKKFLTTFICMWNLLCLGQRIKKIDSTVTTIIIPAKPKVLKDTIAKMSKLDSFINYWIGRPYIYGGTTIKGIDCSAFAQKFYKDVFDVQIPRTALTQFKSSTKVDKNEINLYDLIFFLSDSSPSGWHVAVYLGNNLMVHAANRKRGVVIDQLTNGLIKKIYAIGSFNYRIENPDKTIRPLGRPLVK